jgi:hypothetical protein
VDIIIAILFVLLCGFAVPFGGHRRLCVLSGFVLVFSCRLCEGGDGGADLYSFVLSLDFAPLYEYPLLCLVAFGNASRPLCGCHDSSFFCSSSLNFQALGRMCVCV